MGAAEAEANAAQSRAQKLKAGSVAEAHAAELGRRERKAAQILDEAYRESVHRVSELKGENRRPSRQP